MPITYGSMPQLEMVIHVVSQISQFMMPVTWFKSKLHSEKDFFEVLFIIYYIFKILLLPNPLNENGSLTAIVVFFVNHKCLL